MKTLVLKEYGYTALYYIHTKDKGEYIVPHQHAMNLITIVRSIHSSNCSCACILPPARASLTSLTSL